MRSRILFLSWLLTSALGITAAPNASAVDGTFDLLLVSRTNADNSTLFSNNADNSSALDAADLLDGDLGVGFRLGLTQRIRSGLSAQLVYDIVEFDERINVEGQPNQFDTEFAGFVGFGDIARYMTRYDSSLTGGELNLLYSTGGGNVSLIGGLRYVDLTEMLDIDARTAGGIIDMLQVDTQNNLFGGQLGVQGLLLSGRRGWLSTSVKYAMFENHASQETFGLEPGGIGQQTEFASDDELATMLDFNITGVFRIKDNINLRGGATVRRLWDVALAPNQTDDTNFQSNDPAIVDNEGNLTVGGGFLGLEILF